MRAVRAAEAKLRGRITIVVLIAGPPWSEHPRAVPRGFSLRFCYSLYDFKRFLFFIECASSFFNDLYWFQGLVFFDSTVLVDMTFENAS